MLEAVDALISHCSEGYHTQILASMLSWRLIVVSNHEGQLDHTFDVRKPSLSRVNGLYEFYVEATQILLLQLNSPYIGGGRGALGRCLRKEYRQQRVDENLSGEHGKSHEGVITRKS